MQVQPLFGITIGGAQMKIEVGFSIPSWEMPSVERSRMRTMAAILRAPNPVHWDPNLVASLPFEVGKKTINQGPLGLSYMVNMLHDWAGPGCIKRIFMTFPHIVLSEDRVVANGQVTQIDGTDIECDIWLERDEKKLLVGNATVSGEKLV